VIVDIVLVGIVYFFGSLIHNADWNESHINHKHKIEIDYSHNFLNKGTYLLGFDYPYSSNDERYNQIGLKYKYILNNKINYGISYAYGIYSYESFYTYNINETYTTAKTNYNSNLIMLNSTFTGIRPVFGIKPDISLNMGYLNLHETDYNYNNYTFVNKSKQTNTYGILDSKIRLSWKAFFFPKLEKPVFYCDIGTTIKERNVYKYLTLGGYIPINDQIKLHGSFGSKPNYTSNSELISNLSLSIGYQFK